MQDAASGVWHHNLLLIASPSEIYGVFVAAGPTIAAPFIEVGLAMLSELQTIHCVSELLPAIVAFALSGAYPATN